MKKNLKAEDIEQMALEARITLTEVFRRSGVSRGSFYRWKRGEGNMLLLTQARMCDAIKESSQ